MAARSVGTNANEPASKPNVILIMADDLGYECFGANGNRQYHPPNLDRLAAEGVRFDHAYSTPLCTPTRVMLVTGKPPRDCSGGARYTLYGSVARYIHFSGTLCPATSEMQYP